jgi:hypothetical protein
MARLDEATKRELAVKASCDPRTIEKELRGTHARGLAGHRARRALAEAGLLPPEALQEPPPKHPKAGPAAGRTTTALRIAPRRP